MGKKILLAAAVIIALCIMLVHTGQFNTVKAALTPWANKGSAAVTSGIHAAAPHVTAVPKVAVPKQVSQGAQDVNNTLKKAGLTGGQDDARTPSNAVRTLDRIPTTTQAPASPYKRSDFGAAWTDTSHGCSVEQDALLASLTNITRTGCTVTTGTLTDPYTGVKSTYTNAHPATLTLDAVVPLAWAWNNGASTWTAAKRAKFAADPTNLTVIADSSATGKNDQGPAGWTPQNDSYRCTYVTRFVYIVNEYNLTFNARDQAVIRRDLAQC